MGTAVAGSLKSSVISLQFRVSSLWLVVWEVKDKKIRLVEVIYAGTHEKAPY